jgi:hypothetical protein
MVGVGHDLGLCPVGMAGVRILGQLSGDGSRVICCGMKGCRVLVPLIDFEAICVGDAVGFSPMLVVFCMLAGFVRSGSVWILSMIVARTMIMRIRMRMIMMVEETLWERRDRLGEKTINGT